MEKKISEIIEGNKLIAEFMGYSEEKSGAGPTIVRPDGFAQDNYPNYRERELENLMPVVEKIRSLSFVIEIKIGFDCDVFISKGDERMSFVAYSKLIDALFVAVVQFIKWYNANNKQ